VTSVWLIRHAESTRAPGTAIGVTDPPLSDQGVAQARVLAATLAPRPLVRVVSSDRQRALATARIVAQPHHLEVESSAALREIDFGVWEGRSLADLWAEEPDAAKAWEQDIRSTPPSFGESLYDLERRVAMFWAALGPLPPVGEVAIVAHRGSLAALRALITGSTTADAFASELALGAAIPVIAS
jgi:broad specificity phosphatase PhoE